MLQGSRQFTFNITYCDGFYDNTVKKSLTSLTVLNIASVSGKLTTTQFVTISDAFI